MRHSFSPKSWLVLATLSSAFSTAVPGAITTNVTVGDNFFAPASLAIKANDTVKWTWRANNIAPHSSTGPGTPALWDTGLKGANFTFSRTFNAAGAFPYHCTLHPFMTGSITVQAVNAPPTVGLTAPANSAVFAAPWTGVLHATVADSGGTVTNIAFFAGTSRLGAVHNPPTNVSFTVTNLAAGNYGLTAIATDNAGASATSAPVAITVIAPSPVSLVSPQRLSATSFRFEYSANPGLRYVVRRSENLPNWTPLSTNTATSQQETFTDNSAAGAVELYSVQRLPNP